MAGKGGGQPENSSNSEMIILVTVVLVMLGLWAIWTFFRPVVVLPAFAIDAAFIFVIEHTKGLGQIGTASKEFINSFFNGSRSSATDITWEQFAFVRGAVGSQVRWVITPIIVGLAIWIVYRMKGQGYKRVFSLGGGKGNGKGNGAAAQTVRKSWTLRMAPVSAGGEIVQPTRQPVTL